MHFVEHSGKRQIPIETGLRSSVRATVVIIALCAVAAWGLVLGLGATLLSISGY